MSLAPLPPRDAGRAARTARLHRWLVAEALPLWTGAGLAPDGTVWEALSHDGTPRPDIPRRMRVQARQAHVFARSAGLHGAPETLKPLAETLFRTVMDRGFDAEGRLCTGFAPDGRRLAADHDLYDLAFVLLAAASLAEAGVEVAEDLDRLHAALATLKAPAGWYETQARRRPRRQNPHMHLFEAATEAHAATGSPRWRAIAEEILELFGTAFLAADGRILEMFEDDLAQPALTGQQLEPGHMAEWIWLLHRNAAAFGRPTGIDPGAIWAAVQARRLPSGLLADTEDPPSDVCRTWPQTEFLRAALVMAPEGPLPDEALEQLWRFYLEPVVPGGWVDKLDRRGVPVSEVMPASTLYHLAEAVTAWTYPEGTGPDGTGVRPAG